MGASSTNATPLALAASCENAESPGAHKISATAAVLARRVRSEARQRTPASGYGPISTSKNFRRQEMQPAGMKR